MDKLDEKKQAKKIYEDIVARIMLDSYFRDLGEKLEYYSHINRTGKKIVKVNGVEESRPATAFDIAEARVSYAAYKRKSDLFNKFLNNLNDLSTYTASFSSLDAKIVAGLNILLSNLDVEEVSIINSAISSDLLQIESHELSDFNALKAETIENAKDLKVLNFGLGNGANIGSCIESISKSRVSAVKNSVSYSFKKVEDYRIFKPNFKLIDRYVRYVEDKKIKPVANSNQRISALKHSLEEKGRSEVILKYISDLLSELRYYPNEFTNLNNKLVGLENKYNKILGKANKKIEANNFSEIVEVVKEQDIKEELEAKRNAEMAIYADLAYQLEKAMAAGDYDLQQEIERKMKECARDSSLQNSDLDMARMLGSNRYYNEVYKKRVTADMIKEELMAKNQLSLEMYRTLREEAIRTLELSGAFRNLPSEIVNGDSAVMSYEEYKERLIQNTMRSILSSRSREKAMPSNDVELRAPEVTLSEQERKDIENVALDNLEFDEELEKLEIAHNLRQISDVEYNAKRRKIIDRKVEELAMTPKERMISFMTARGRDLSGMSEQVIERKAEEFKDGTSGYMMPYDFRKILDKWKKARELERKNILDNEMVIEDENKRTK